jgi:two-component system, chemotaxis family, protein-glutamate methylesterase/glutaminase
MQALEEGAVEVIARPRLGIQGFLYESAVLLVDAIRAAAASRARPRAVRVVPAPRRSAQQKFSVVAIGASTGGTEAIRLILESVSAACSGIVVVQHMPEVFTRMFAQRLDTVSAMEVREAEAGDVVRAGLALVAPGNRHLVLRRQGMDLRVELNDGPLVARHRPSVDVLFRSVADAAGATAAGVLLTGMGADGAAGLLEMRRTGATTIAQDAATSVVFGMPKEAIALGAPSRVLPLDAIAAAID